MKYNKLTTDKWNELDSSGSLVSGYKSTWLSLNDNEESNLNIFKDENNHYHLAIKVMGLKNDDVEDPGVNGLQVSLTKYRIGKGDVNQFIDVQCRIQSYLKEFTEVVKEIAHCILKEKEKPEVATKKVISNWVSFWANQRTSILSEEDQIGMICELLFLEKLCEINPEKALNSWRGPLGEKHDFNFTDWNIEVKGTRKKVRTHTINGIEQLMPSKNKTLGFISFMVSINIEDQVNSTNLPKLIEIISNKFFRNKPVKQIRFNDLLAGIGYNPVYVSEYAKFNLEVISTQFYVVNRDFPKLITDMLNCNLDNRVSSVRYDINLDGIVGKELNQLNIGDYFY